ncbi:Exosome non-catalytic core component [Neocucurbitaria cava]|uniref:Exosome non-catalytic core component n=1 Tax=Neocucurbitaria cava TaxID=798079 RepID=A0A9W8Y033_9PLEO|nr:Exosome non-catalytic core component [Neocucurbitaria cava]
MPLDTSTYSLALLRLDGRRWNELRRIHAQISTQASADGSSYLEMGNTKILVSVTGPSEGSRQQQATQSRGGGAAGLAKVSVEINFAGFSGIERRKRKSDKRTSEMEHCLRRWRTACCINAATLALIDAGVPMTDYLVACTAASSASATAADNAAADDPLLDLNNQEELELPFLTVATLGESEGVAVCVLENRVRMERVEGMLAVGIEGCKRLRGDFGWRC